MGFPGGSVVKTPPVNAAEMGSIPGSGRSLGGGNGNPLQYSCPENSMDRQAWQATGLQGVRHDLVTEHACTPHTVLGTQQDINRFKSL